MNLSHLDHLVLTVRDIETTIEFYTQVLGMQRQDFVAADGGRRTALLFGQHKINLHQSGAEFAPHAQTVQPGSADLCFLSETALTDWQSHLDQCHVKVAEGPVARTGATGPILSIYLRDPDGNLLEISNQV
ncbi:MAG: VOC family protein [Planktomarina sp.]